MANKFPCFRVDVKCVFVPMFSAFAEWTIQEVDFFTFYLYICPYVFCQIEYIFFIELITHIFLPPISIHQKFFVPLPLVYPAYIFEQADCNNLLFPVRSSVLYYYLLFYRLRYFLFQHFCFRYCSDKS